MEHDKIPKRARHRAVPAPHGLDKRARDHGKDWEFLIGEANRPFSFTVQLSDMGILCFRIYDGHYVYKNFYLTLEEMGDALGFTFTPKAPESAMEAECRRQAELLAQGIDPKSLKRKTSED